MILSRFPFLEVVLEADCFTIGDNFMVRILDIFTTGSVHWNAVSLHPDTLLHKKLRKITQKIK